MPWITPLNKEEERNRSKLTLKIEVNHEGKFILLRFVHCDKFYSMEYPKIALRIAHNMIQNDYLKAVLKQADNKQNPKLVKHECHFSINPRQNGIFRVL